MVEHTDKHDGSGEGSLEQWISALHHDFVIGAFRTAFLMREAVGAAENKRNRRDMIKRMNEMARQLGLEETSSDPHGDENERLIIGLLEAERERGFPLYNGLTVVALWAALEAYLDDAIATVLFWEPEFLDRTNVEKIKGFLLDFVRMDSYERCLHLVEKLRMEAVGRNPGLDRYDHVLKSLKLGDGRTEFGLRTTLNEFYSVRNLVAHKGGTVDERFMKECPQFKAELASDLRITTAKVSEYLFAGLTYGNLVAKRIFDQLGVKNALVKRLYDPKQDAQAVKRRKAKGK